MNSTEHACHVSWRVTIAQRQSLNSAWDSHLLGPASVTSLGEPHLGESHPGMSRSILTGNLIGKHFHIKS